MEQKPSSAGVWALVIIVVVVIIGGIIYYEHSKNESSEYSAAADSGTGADTDAGYGSTASTGAPMIPYYTLMSSSSPTVGAYLAAANGMTLYAYSKDKSGQSLCTGSCATAWPPYTVSSTSPLSVSPDLTGNISTIARTDGTTQVTYNGMPLYFWQKDMVPGDVTGNGVGGFAVAKP